MVGKGCLFPKRKKKFQKKHQTHLVFGTKRRKSESAWDCRTTGPLGQSLTSQWATFCSSDPFTLCSKCELLGRWHNRIVSFFFSNKGKNVCNSYLLPLKPGTTSPAELPALAPWYSARNLQRGRNSFASRYLLFIVFPKRKCVPKDSTDTFYPRRIILPLFGANRWHDLAVNLEKKEAKSFHASKDPRAETSWIKASSCFVLILLCEMINTKFTCKFQTWQILFPLKKVVGDRKTSLVPISNFLHNT